MGKLVPGNDGMEAEEVGPWVDEKLTAVKTYVEISSLTRRKFLPPNIGGAAYIDLFCGPGLSKIKDTPRYVDGTAVSAWKASVEKGAPFTAVFIADKDSHRLSLCASRLRELKAPVIELKGAAVAAAEEAKSRAPQHGLNFSFLDPYSLGALDFRILQSLAKLKRIDVLVHLSTMDMARNIDSEAAEERAEFEAFAPKWREHVPAALAQSELRNRLSEYWKMIAERDLQMTVTDATHAVVNSRNRSIYWLRLLTRSGLAEKFWKGALKAMPQQTPDMFGGQ